MKSKMAKLICEQLKVMSMYFIENDINEDNNGGIGNIKLLRELVDSMVPFFVEQLDIQRPVSIRFINDGLNAEMPLANTAHYDFGNNTISVYTTARHPKDIMRSVAHELVHHKQNCDGKFEGQIAESDYIQKNQHLRSLEEEAFSKGNLLFRDWEALDGNKKKYKQ